ncbi:MAG: M23 family metallopeptidase [Deltaproteobacteria bacterium]|nr:M23 family metallopeptidase [Deltaproteobacteria bacterium]
MQFKRSHLGLLIGIVSSVFFGCAEFEDVLTPGPMGSDQAIRTRPIRNRPHPLKKESRAPIVTEQSLSERFIWPVTGRVSSGFGPRRGRAHDGIDIIAPRGTPILASAGGEVLYAGRISGYGNLVILKHPGNFFTAYAHLSQTHVRKGNRVRQGKVIGNVGRTGRASANHLHFEIRRKTRPQNPLEFLPGD